MPFENKNLAPVSVGMGDEPKIWSYFSEVDDIGQIGVFDYFLEAADKFNEGDILNIKSTAVIPFAVAKYYVSSITKDAEGNPTGIIVTIWSTPGS